VNSTDIATVQRTWWAAADQLRANSTPAPNETTVERTPRRASADRARPAMDRGSLGSGVARDGHSTGAVQTTRGPASGWARQDSRGRCGPLRSRNRAGIARRRRGHRSVGVREGHAARGGSASGASDRVLEIPWPGSIARMGARLPAASPRDHTARHCQWCATRPVPIVLGSAQRAIEAAGDRFCAPLRASPPMEARRDALTPVGIGLSAGGSGARWRSWWRGPCRRARARR
jgi:hypothetical protein